MWNDNVTRTERLHGWAAVVAERKRERRINFIVAVLCNSVLTIIGALAFAGLWHIGALLCA